MNVQCALGCLYSSSGVGQVVGVIGVTISLIAALVQRILATYYSCRGNEQDKDWALDSMKFSLWSAKAFALGMIPFIGGIFAANSCSSFIQG